MGRKTENSAFICQNCGGEVIPVKKGTIRNHCPSCLFSLHVDEKIGDRQNDCHGLMKPSAIRYHTQKGYQIIHQCQTCGFERANIVAEDDNMVLVREIMKNSF